MAVPSGNYLVNTTGGAFSDTTEGGTILGNTSTNTAITKALALKDNAAEWARGTLPANSANGLVANDKPLSGGTFAYSAAGKYVIASSSDTLSGVSKTNILITGRGTDMAAIHQFQGKFGAKTVTAFRLNRFSWTHTKSHSPAGGTPSARYNWLDVATAGMSTPSAPAAFTGNDAKMWDPVNDSFTNTSDSAANPTRAIPGELVMKVDFVTLAPATGGDFFDYSAITGM